MDIYTCLNNDRVLFLNSANKSEVIYALVQNAYQTGAVQNLEEFSKAINERENIVSTGIGLGVAVPHSKLSSIKNFFVSIAVLRDKVDWDAIDQAPVNVVFLIGGPDNQQTEYLKLLSKLILLVKHAGRRKSLLKCKTSEEVLGLFTNL